MYSNFAFDDATEQECSLPGWVQEYRQVSTGHYRGTTVAIELPRLTILRERINVKTEQVFSAPKGQLVFYYYYDSGSAANDLVSGGANSTNVGFAWDWSDRVGFMHAGSDLLMVVLDPQLLGVTKLRSGSLHGDARIQAAHAAEWLVSVLHVLADEEGFRHLRDQLQAILPELIHDRLSLLYENCKLESDAGIAKSEEIYRRLRDRLYGTPDEALTVSALSRELSVTPAVLRKLCTEFTGVQLDNLLVKLRLNGARRSLIGARGQNCRVSDIAMDWGFMHWSRFAARYRTLFGECPSETLQCATPHHLHV